MKKALFVLIVVVLLVVLGIIGIFFNFSKKQTNSSTSTSTTSSGFPVVNSVTSSGSTIGTNEQVSIPLSNGNKVTTPDFIHNGTTIQDPANSGTYYLAGSSGACKPDGTCPKAGTQTDFTILYYPSTGSFNIGLATEPLGEVRIEAEDYLMKELGLTESQMCDLKYSIGTSTYVNQEYGGENLGFSFCPGAVQLPS